MSTNRFPQYDDPLPAAHHPELVDVVLAEFAEERPAPPRRFRWKTPLALFVLTCLSTAWVGYQEFESSWTQGLFYAASVMTILVCHEAGHFVQARRYGVYASLPYFLPIPVSPIGTMGAFIAMDARVPHRKALFDIGISGPLAGLVPTLIFTVWGVYMAEIKPVIPGPGDTFLGAPLLFQVLSEALHDPPPLGHAMVLGPLALAGWVGLLITSLNLFPIGQLDGGHILYSLLRRRANFVAVFILQAAIFTVIVGAFVFGQRGLVGWTLMLVLLTVMGPRHPPTADDYVPLGRFRVVLGWLTLAFLILGFTPIPIRLP